MKSAFLANMSHEIRTPLNAIVGFSQLLGSDMELGKEEKNEFISLINTNNTLLLKLINDILDLSRIESGQISFTYADCDLSQLVDEIFNTHKLLMPEGVELIKETPEKPAIIYTDRFRLTQVVTNFINNATKFTSHGYIKVKYEYDTDNQHILLSVEDTGKGIPKDKINQVFERFQKLDEFAKGTGLGLAISLSIIKHSTGRSCSNRKKGKAANLLFRYPILLNKTFIGFGFFNPFRYDCFQEFIFRCHFRTDIQTDVFLCFLFSRKIWYRNLSVVTVFIQYIPDYHTCLHRFIQAVTQYAFYFLRSMESSAVRSNSKVPTPLGTTKQFKNRLHLAFRCTPIPGTFGFDMCLYQFFSI